jgi:hypothetical protein
MKEQDFLSFCIQTEASKWLTCPGMVFRRGSIEE